MDHPFFKLSPAVDTRETGSAYPALESFENYDFNALNSVYKLKYREFPSVNPDIRFKVAKRAKLCDIMSQAAINASGLMVSDKAKQIISQYVLVPHQFYPATVLFENKSYDYFWLHLVWEDCETIVDWANSSFYKQRGTSKEPLNISSAEHLQQIRLGFAGRFMVGYNYLNFTKTPPFDLWLTPIKPRIVISSQMAEAFKKHFLSGVRLENLDNIKFG